MGECEYIGSSLIGGYLKIQNEGKAWVMIDIAQIVFPLMRNSFYSWPFKQSESCREV